MKFIKNSIDSEHLQDTISTTDLETEMASCDMKTVLLNGHSKEVHHSEKNKMPEVVEVAKLTNGIHGKSSILTKCNGKVNGFYDEVVVEEEDFQLVLEDSSEESGSPLKKIDDETISAPQIVQEIEDLLGINSSSAGIQEELNNLDGTDSIEDNLENVDDMANDANIISQEVFEETEEDKKINEVSSKEEETVQEGKKASKLMSETTECDTSSHMSIVYDEVEVGSENRDLKNANYDKLTQESNEDVCKVESTTETNTIKCLDKSSDAINQVVDNNKDEKVVEDDVVVDNNKDKKHIEDNILIESTNTDLPLSQKSDISENASEWLVVDSVETSDEEKLSQSQEVSNSFEDEKKESPVIKTCKSIDALEKGVKNPVCESRTTDRDDNMTGPTTSGPQSRASSPYLPAKGDCVRKRNATEVAEEVELKKPKLEEQSSIVESSSSPVLKRSSPETLEHESKRTKCGTAHENVIENNDYHLMDDDNNEETDIGKTIVESSSISQDMNDTQDSENNKDTILDDKKNDAKNFETSKEKEIQMITNSCNIEKSESENISTVLSESSVSTPQLQDEQQLAASSNVVDQRNKIDSTSLKCSSLTSNMNDPTLRKDELSSNKVSLSHEDSVKSFDDATISSCEESQQKTEDKIQESMVLEEKSKDENIENVSSSIIDSSTKEVDINFDQKTSNNVETSEIEPNQAVDNLCTKVENNPLEMFKPKSPVPPTQNSCNKNLSSSIKELENSLNKNKHEKELSSQDSKDTQSKTMTNLDLAIERVVEKSRLQTERKVPILKKFHKDQLKKLTRSELEDITVLKMCEAVGYKSEIGQMRLRTQHLEETNDMWRKKVQQVEKQNRELEMVLKRFLTELAHIKRENQSKVPMPIKVTRSVGLQVVLASSVHGLVPSSKNRTNSESLNQQQQTIKTRYPEKEKEKPKELVKASTFIPPSALGRGRGRPSKTPTPTSTPQNSRPATPQSSPALKVTPPTTPVKVATVSPAKPPPVVPIKTIPTPNKDLEVIDLTEKDERAKTSSQSPIGGSIRVSPSTQVCFVQQSAAPSSTQQMTYLVQNSGQRPQLVVATSAATSQRPITNISLTRPPPALALPVFRASGQLIPVRTTPQVGVRTNSTTAGTPTKPIAQALRLQPQTNLKHPAPLPSAPIITPKPGMKSPPPKPQLKIAKTVNGIMLSWSMSLTKDMAEMASYQLYAYQEGNQPPSTGLWKKVGDVKALPLPMACTLTQFIEGHKYHFAVRAVDVHSRIGPFSLPSSILLTK